MPIPKSFDSVASAQKWADEFANWYNNCHLHSGINFITPAQCHRGEGPAIMEKRNKIIANSLIPKSHKFKMPWLQLKSQNEVFLKGMGQSVRCT